MESQAGKLLVATPRLIDPNFFRTVILMLQHDEEGTLGVVLNRQTDALAAEHIPDWADHVAEPGLIHYGGPVEPEVAIGIGLTVDGMPTHVAGLSLVDLASPPPDGAPSIRVYSGYAGWSEGQLEAELATGSWYVVQAAPEDPFDDPAEQWRRVLKRQSGLLAMVSTFPDDVSLN